MAMEFRPVSASGMDTLEIQEYNIQDERQMMTTKLENSAEIDSIVSTINAYDPNTIVTFGGEVAEEISKCSDQILNSVNMAQINESGELLTTLGRIMDKFDLQEITQMESKGFFGKVFGGIQKKLEQLLAKYHTMGEEVDKIYIKLKEYESEIKGSNQKLEHMFQANVGYYRQLVKYIVAGEQGIRELDAHIGEMRQEYERTRDNLIQMDINNLEQAKSMLEGRVMDLKMAENVAMQSVPMIKSMQFGNLNLIRKINSAFIITLPVFKQALTQAVLLKRQRIQAEAMQALDDRTNEMLLKNAQNTANQTIMTAQLASGSSVKIETLEKSWSTIVHGIDETRRIQEDAKKKREEDSARLLQLKEDYKAKMGGQSAYRE